MPEAPVLMIALQSVLLEEFAFPGNVRLGRIRVETRGDSHSCERLRIRAYGSDRMPRDDHRKQTGQFALWAPPLFVRPPP